MTETIFEGFVERFDGDTAYVRLTASDGSEFETEFPTANLVAAGVREHRRFRYRVMFEAVPDCPVDERAIEERIESQLGGGETR